LRAARVLRENIFRARAMHVSRARKKHGGCEAACLQGLRAMWCKRSLSRDVARDARAQKILRAMQKSVDASTHTHYSQRRSVMSSLSLQRTKISTKRYCARKGGIIDGD
jgi:hypothetical protein